MFETWPTPSPACMAKHNNRLAVRDGAPSRRNGINRHQSVVGKGWGHRGIQHECNLWCSSINE
eukprot:scaffold108310_cov19-Tisochrysis_lutea.AAC.2